MKAVVTGARGFVGRHLTRHLATLGVEVVSLDVDDQQPVDVTDREAVARRIADAMPDVVYHLAARSHVGAVVDRRTRRGGQRRGHPHRRRRVRRGADRARPDRRQRRPVRRGRCRRPPRRRAHRVSTAQPLRRQQGRGRTGRARLPTASTASAWCARARSTTPARGSRRRSSCRGWRRASSKRNAESATRSRSGTAIRYVTSATCATSYARTRSSPSRARPERRTTCARVAVCASAMSPRCSPHATRPLRIVTDTELVRAVDVPVLVGDPTKLVAATGWQPRHSLDETLDAVLQAARAS